MADVKISALPAATTPLAGTEVLPVVQGTSTVKVANNDLRPKQIQSNATSGVLQVTGPAAASTRVMTTPNANFTVARTDAAQTFTGAQTFETFISTSSAPTIASITQQSFGVSDYVLQNSTVTKTLFTLPATCSCSGLLFLNAETANNTRGSDIFYFYVSNNVFTATKLASNGVASFTTSMALVGNDVQVSFSYTIGLGGNTRFFASGFASVCNNI